MAEQTEQTDVVAEFIKDLVPKDLLETAQLLVSLKYPIPDKKSLVLQLKQRKTDHPQGNVADSDLSHSMLKLIEQVTGAFNPEDFGLDSPRSALEKFFARTRQDYTYPPVPRRRSSALPNLPPSIPEPPLYSNPFFGPPGPCQKAAAQLWREHLDSPEVRLIGIPDMNYYSRLQELANACKLSWTLPFSGRCADAGNVAYFACLMRGGDGFQCMDEANHERGRCLRLLDPFGGGGPRPGR